MRGLVTVEQNKQNVVKIVLGLGVLFTVLTMLEVYGDNQNLSSS